MTGLLTVDDIKREIEIIIKRNNQIIQRKFKDAESECSEMGSALIEHGAMCYYNNNQEFKRVLLLLERASLTKTSALQRLWCRLFH